MAKIIVAAPPIPGEVLPLLQLAGGLAARGHDITVLTGSGFRARVEQAGLAFAPLTGSADYDIGAVVGSPERAAQTPGPELMNWDWIRLFADPMADEHRALQELLDKDPDQYLIGNLLFLGALPVKLGVPGRSPLRWVAFGVGGVAHSSADSTYFGPVPVGPGEDQQAANRAANAGFTAAFQPTQDHVDGLLRAMGVAGGFPNFGDGVYTAPDATAVLGVPGFEFHRDDLPASIHLIGALPAEPASGREPPSWWSELDGSRPVVVVTQGTLANGDLSQLVEPALTGLAGLDVTVVAALGGADPAALTIDVPANARVASYIPFDELLPKANLLITNGGSGGVHRALSSGVPLIIAGVTEDKPANAARVAHHRLGLDLHTATPTAETVAQAAASVLADAEIRQNVTRLTEVYAGHNPVAEIERLLLG